MHDSLLSSLATQLLCSVNLLLIDNELNSALNSYRSPSRAFQPGRDCICPSCTAEASVDCYSLLPGQHHGAAARRGRSCDHFLRPHELEFQVPIG